MHASTRVAAIAFAALAVHPLGAQSARAPLHVRTAIVSEDLSVRPLPQVPLRLVSPRGDTVRLDTDLDGIADAQVAPGSYTIESPSPFEVAGTRMVWRVPVVVTASGARVELTPRNATAPDGSALAIVRASAPASRRVSEEAQVYEHVKSGVFTVWGDEGKGSGFLVDPSGLVLTNAHVVRGSTEVRVQLRDDTKVRARIVHVDPDRDVAVLAIPMSRCTGCAVLPLADPSAGPLAVAGERVLAIGSPLNQTGMLTLGIVSKVEERAILSDVNINHGNSGGPLLNAGGSVIAINTFGDFTDQGGPGVSGSILITQAIPALERGRAALASGEAKAPADSLLPNAPRQPFPLEAWRAAATQARYDFRPYSGSGGPFDFVILTPTAISWRSAQAANQVLERRRQRESRAGVGSNERVDPIQNAPGWTEYTGERRSVVLFNVLPKVGETRGSFWGNMLGAVAAGALGSPYYSGTSILEFKGDFRQMTLYRDSVEVVPVDRNRAPAVLNIETYRARGKDYAFQGIYAYRPTDFAPRPDGSFATYTLRIEDTAHPDRPVVFRLAPRTIERIWKDFDGIDLGPER